MQTWIGWSKEQRGGFREKLHSYCVIRENICKLDRVVNKSFKLHES